MNKTLRSFYGPLDSKNLSDIVDLGTNQTIKVI